MKKEKNCPVSCTKKTSIGGQALMEGIMMRGPEKTALAVRNTKGEIVIETSPTSVSKRGKFFKLPVIRGVFNYIDSMVIGTKSLMRSAEIAGLEEAEAELRREKEEKKAKKAARKNKNATSCEEVTPVSENAEPDTADETAEPIEKKEKKK